MSREEEREEDLRASDVQIGQAEAAGMLLYELAPWGHLQSSTCSSSDAILDSAGYGPACPTHENAAAEVHASREL